MKKKILIIAQLQVWDIKKNVGKEVVSKTIEAMSKEYDVTIISPDKSLDFENVDHKYLEMNIQFKLNTIKYIGYLVNTVFFYFFYQKVKSIIKKENISADIVYCIGQWSGFVAKKIFKNKAFIVNRYFGIAWDPKTFFSFRQRLKFFFKLISYKKFGNVAVMTNDGTKGRQFLETIGFPKDKILFIKNGINKEFSIDEKFIENFKKVNNILPDTNLFLTVSRLAKWKRVNVSIELMEKLIVDYPNSKLLIVGYGSELNALKELVIKKNLQDNIIFVGSVSRDEIHSFYSMANIFLSFYDYSNAGNPLFEAMLHGKCIITLNNGDTGSFIDKNSCVLLEDLDEDEMLKKALEVLENKKLRDDLGKAALNKLNKTFQNWNERTSTEFNFIEQHYKEYKQN